MKNLKTKIGAALFAAAAITTFSVPVEAKDNGWIYVGRSTDDVRMWVKPLGWNGPYRVFMDLHSTDNGEPDKREMDCENQRMRFVRTNGSRSLWTHASPDTMAMDKVEAICGGW